MAMNARLLRPLASGFNPKTIAGLVGWWDPSDVSTVLLNSGNVEQLNDKSGLARHATQTTPNNRPAYSGTINGRNVMTFDGSNDRLVTGLESNTLTGYATFFCVCQIDATWSDATANNKSPLFGRNASGAGASYGINLTTNAPASGTLGLSVQWRGFGFNLSGSPPVSKGVPQLFVGRSAATGRLRRVNGSGSEATSFPPAAGTDAAAGNFLIIGADLPELRYWSDLIAEVLVYDRDLTLAEIAKIEGYLAWKWGLQAQLPYDHPYARSFPGFGSQAVPTDADTLTYLAAVKAADGTGVEVGVANAVDAFVTGCKSDGIWDAIKASCILAGARTLAGALTPLKGAAPTNVNFVSGDYNRKTGLVGDGSTKHLDSNRLGSADPTLDAHLSIYLAAISSTTPAVYIGCSNNQQYGHSGGAFFGFASFRNFNNVSSSVRPVGLAGVSAASGDVITARFNGTNLTGTGSSAPPGRNYFVFCGRNASTPFNAQTFTTARASFYSIGTLLDLALLDTRVSALITAIGAAI